MGGMPRSEIGEMPKQHIGVTPQEHGSINVAWGRSYQHVQISVAGPIGWRDQYVGQQFAGRSDVDPDAGLDWHLQVQTRNEINDLIRTLRKARDQAFGADA